MKATDHGIEKEAKLVVVSPLTRAIQTAMLSIDQARLMADLIRCANTNTNL